MNELKLTNVARASLEELLEDYRENWSLFVPNYLRTRQAEEWDKNSKEAFFVRGLAIGKTRLNEDGTKATKVTHGQQIRKLEQDFLNEGGLRERMTRARIENRNRQRVQR